MVGQNRGLILILLDLTLGAQHVWLLLDTSSSLLQMLVTHVVSYPERVRYITHLIKDFGVLNYLFGYKRVCVCVFAGLQSF